MILIVLSELLSYTNRRKALLLAQKSYILLIQNSHVLLNEENFIFYSMCELHETNVKIGTNPEALEQFICIAHSSHYDIWHAQVTMNMFASLSHTREAHPYLASESVVDGLMNVCEYRSEVGDTRMDVLLLR